MAKVNVVRCWAFDDAPLAVKAIALDLVTEGDVPMWVSHTLRRGEFPSYLVGMMSKACIDFNNESVFLKKCDDGSEVRVGCRRKDDRPFTTTAEDSMANLFAKLANTDLQILTGDSLTILPTLAENSVQCCVTSPPYWGLRDYDHPAQIGAEPTPDLYVANLVAIFREVRRVLRKDGIVWLNVGDGYARNGGTGNCGPNAMVANTKKLIQKRNCKVPDCWGLKDRDLMGLPWRVAFALQADGWVLRSRVTWIKKTAMPESVRNRPSSATEEVFLLTKSPTYFYNPDGFREPSGANARNYWIIGSDANGSGHPATFPAELARRCILLASRAGDTVLDPFGGSGTTGRTAIELGRKAVLVELNPAYAEMSRERNGHATKHRIEAVNS